MQNRKQLNTNLKFTALLRHLATAYEEVSVTKLQKVRGKVLVTRDYLTQISDVFNVVKQNYKVQLEKGKNQDNAAILSFNTSKKNGKTVSILISSNNKLYGDIGKKVFRLFQENISVFDTDIYIVGKVGREYYNLTGLNRPYRYIDFPEDDVNQAMDTVLKVIDQYEHVNVFYGKFINVLTQDPKLLNLTGGEEEIVEETMPTKKRYFYFEPSVEKVLEFFESQIFASLFKQTLHESELSHTASRIRQMETALENIEETEGKLLRYKSKLHKRMDDMRQIQRIAGMKMWRKA